MSSIEIVKAALWDQYGAAIDMLDNAMAACPDDLWRDEQKNFWYGAFHALFFCEVYAFGKVEGFVPRAPFGLEELDPAGVMPPRVYSREELRDYLRYCRERCREMVNMLTEENVADVQRFSWIEATRLELLLYNARHVQHHAAQLNLLLRQAGVDPPRWVKHAKA